MIAPSGYGKTTLCKNSGWIPETRRGEVLLDGKPLRDIKGCCPVQMIWQHPEQAVNPRLRMREVIAEGDQVEERIVRQLGIEEEWMGRYPAGCPEGNCRDFVLQGLWERAPNFCCVMRSVPCWISSRRARSGIFCWRRQEDVGLA